MSTVWPWVSIGHRDNVIVIVPGCEHHPGRCKDDACGEQRVHHAHQIGVPWFVHTGRAAAGGVRSYPANPLSLGMLLYTCEFEYSFTE